MRSFVFLSLILCGCLENPVFMLDEQTFEELSETEIQTLCESSLYDSCSRQGGAIQDVAACVAWLGVLKEELPNESVKPKYDCWQGSLCDADASCDIGCSVMPKDSCERFGCQTETGTPYNAGLDCFDDQNQKQLYCFGDVSQEAICPAVINVVFSPTGELYVGGFCDLKPGWFPGNRRWILCKDLDELRPLGGASD